MENWRKDARREAVIVDLDALVPKEHLLRKIEKVMDYEWLYERLEPYYCHDNGRPGTDPVVLIKMVLIQHLYGIPSLRQTYQRIQDTISYRWFLGYGLLDTIPHFATVSYAFCKRFPEELTTEIFEHYEKFIHLVDFPRDFLWFLHESFPDTRFFPTAGAFSGMGRRASGCPDFLPIIAPERQRILPKPDESPGMGNFFRLAVPLFFLWLIP